MNSIDRKLLERLGKKKILTKEKAAQFANKYGDCKGRLIEKLLPLYISEERELVKSYARACGLPFLDIRQVEPNPEILRRMKSKAVKKYQAVPVGLAEGKLIVAIKDASDVLKLDELSTLFQDPIQLVLTMPSALQEYMDHHELVLKGPTNPVLSEQRTDGGVDTFHERETRMEEKPLTQFHDQKTAFDDGETFHERNTILNEGETKSKRPKEKQSPRFVIKEQSTTKLDDLLSHAVLNRAEQVRLNSNRLSCEALMRIDGTFVEMAELHPPDATEVVATLRKRLSHQLDEDQCCSQAILNLQDRQRNALALVSIAKNGDRDEVQFLFPYHMPLIQRPMMIIGGKFRKALNAIPPILMGSETGAVFISSPDQMTAWQLIMSVLMQHATEGNPVHHLSWKFSTNIPNIQESVGISEAELLKLIESNAESDQKTLLSLQYLASQKIMDSFVPVIDQGRSLLTSFVSDSAEQARARIIKSVEKIKESGTVVHLHVRRLPRLCTNCLEMREVVPDNLPEWTNAIEEMEHHEATGCEQCGGRGHKGIQWCVDASQFQLQDPTKVEQLITVTDQLVGLAQTAQVDLVEILKTESF